MGGTQGKRYWMHGRAPFRVRDARPLGGREEPARGAGILEKLKSNWIDITMGTPLGRALHAPGRYVGCVSSPIGL